MPVAARFANDPYSVVEARQLVQAATRGCTTEVAEDAALLTSELVSNAVRHARTPFEVLVDRGNGHLRVTVVDESPEPPLVQQPAPDDIGGRGLVLVSRMSHRWGFESRGDGKAVWFELRV
jgi:anti-sigma regulatory factor (Ser/Thr protein kinase)